MWSHYIQHGQYENQEYRFTNLNSVGTNDELCCWSDPYPPENNGLNVSSGNGPPPNKLGKNGDTNWYSYVKQSPQGPSGSQGDDVDQGNIGPQGNDGSIGDTNR